MNATAARGKPLREILMQVRHGKTYYKYMPKDNPDDVVDAAEQQIESLIREAEIKLLVMNISDVAFAAGQHEGLTKGKSVYFERRLETLNRHLAELKGEQENE